MGELAAAAAPARWATWALISLQDGEVYLAHPDGLLITPRCVHVAGDTYRRTRALLEDVDCTRVDRALYMARLVPHVMHDAGGDRTMYFIRGMEWADLVGAAPSHAAPQPFFAPDARDFDRPFTLHERFDSLRACIVGVAQMPDAELAQWARALAAGWCDGPSCRHCGCSEVDACWPPCGWAEPDLCSRCAQERGSMGALTSALATLAVLLLICGVVDARWGLPAGVHLSFSAALLVVLGGLTRRLRRREVV